jgi:hypothetical protein
MSKRILFPGLLFFILSSVFYSALLPNAHAAPLTDTKTLILYDASSGEIPGASLMPFTDFPPGSAPLMYADGATILDTSPSGNETFAGWIASPATTAGFPILDRTAGIQVNFKIQVEHETHANQNRAGFSVIILDQQAKGIELSFWEDQIWVQSDERTGGLFQHGEGSAFATTDLTEYQVEIQGDTYTLTANSSPLLTGPVRDYSNFSGFPNPYRTPNFLFMGDDSTTSQARVKLLFVSVTGNEPVTPTIIASNANTAVPMGTPSSAPAPSATSTLFPTPASARPTIQLCPSGWLLGVMLLTNPVAIKKIRQRSK